MRFRTLEISSAAEIHIKERQLEITTDDGVVVVPIEDLNQIMVHGANIRLSTMDLSILCQNKVALMTLDDRYLPTAIVLSFEGHTRQSKLMHAQVNAAHKKYMELWIDIIKQKITNQSRGLSIMGLDGAERIAEYVAMVDEESVDYCESLAAKEYFS
ncbi:MAG: CRISPR-associated endonuclease Cas1 [Lachnospiraceae bacterium]|nr:CRISPR-associated endonuclease Cas1 [Lachnospiraceae bacterium]